MIYTERSRSFLSGSNLYSGSVDYRVNLAGVVK